MNSAEQNPQLRIAPYILAGGLSSRMGRDKAMLLLGGQTLLARAVGIVRSVEALQRPDNHLPVTICGTRPDLQGADHSVPDLHPGCGPLGGIEAALTQLSRDRTADWAFFLPVDMPFLPSGLVNALLCDWTNAVQNGARVCYLTVDETPQPLVSLIHCTLLPYITESLDHGDFKVTRVLQSGCDALASVLTGAIGFVGDKLYKSQVSCLESSPSIPGWAPTEKELALRHLWFANLNDVRDFSEAETFL